MLKTVCALASMALLATPVATAAKAPKPNLMLDDLKCITVVSAVAESGDAADADTQEGLTALLTYFIGKMHGRDPKVNMSALLSKYEKALDGLDVAAETPRCTAEMGQAMNSLDAMSKAGADGKTS